MHGTALLQVLQTYTGYPTNVEVCVITNAPERLSNVMQSRWNFTSVSVCGTRREMTHAFQLAWEHRDIMELAYEKGEATDGCFDLVIALSPQPFMACPLFS